MSINIGFIGSPGAGKDFLADFLVKSKGYGKVAFADKIKEEFYKVTDYSEEQFKSRKDEKLEEKIRKEMWKFSKKKKVLHGPYYFIDPVIKKVKNSKIPMVITDIRTLAELEIAIAECNPISIIWIIKDSKKVLASKADNIPGTKISIDKVLTFPIFFNEMKNEESKNNFKKLYDSILGGKPLMEPDSNNNTNNKSGKKPLKL